MAKITTHVLDTARGKPAAGVRIVLERKSGDGWTRVGSGQTDDDGRLKTLSDADGVPAGVYRITFDIDGYYARLKLESFYPEASVTFLIRDASQHFHVPLLLAPYGFSTYRGS